MIYYIIIIPELRSNVNEFLEVFQSFFFEKRPTETEGLLGPNQDRTNMAGMLCGRGPLGPEAHQPQAILAGLYDNLYFIFYIRIEGEAVYIFYIRIAEMLHIYYNTYCILRRNTYIESYSRGRNMQYAGGAFILRLSAIWQYTCTK